MRSTVATVPLKPLCGIISMYRQMPSWAVYHCISDGGGYGKHEDGETIWLTQEEKTGGMMFKSNRDKLPGIYEKRYNSELLKEKIADNSMWYLIPAVNEVMNSKGGIRRLKENDLLFRFIDKFFPDGPFAFEPNMQDGRFAFLPEDVDHQGVGICASKNLPGFLEVGHFWYPCEFTNKTIPFGPGQVYVPMFSTRPEHLVEMVQRVYMDYRNPDHMRYCTFLFNTDAVVTLEGNFLDKMSQSIRQIRAALKDESPQIQRNGEGLIQFMQRVMKN